MKLFIWVGEEGYKFLIAHAKDIEEARQVLRKSIWFNEEFDSPLLETTPSEEETTFSHTCAYPDG